jgi:hypothetical protein
MPIHDEFIASLTAFAINTEKPVNQFREAVNYAKRMTGFTVESS